MIINTNSRISRQIHLKFDVSLLPRCKDKGVYKGVHSIEGLEAYADKIANHPFVKLQTQDQVETFAKQHPVSVIGE